MSNTYQFTTSFSHDCFGNYCPNTDIITINVGAIFYLLQENEIYFTDHVLFSSLIESLIHEDIHRTIALSGLESNDDDHKVMKIMAKWLLS